MNWAAGPGTLHVRCKVSGAAAFYGGISDCVATEPFPFLGHIPGFR